MALSTKYLYAQVFLEQTYKTPDAIAFNFILENGDVKSITYKELLDKVLSISSFIREHSKEGDRVILCLPGDIDFIASFFACMFAGVIAVPCMPPLNMESAKRLNLIIKNSKSVFAISNNQILSIFKKLDLIHLLDNSFTKSLHRLLSSIHRNIKVEKSENWIAIEEIPTKEPSGIYFSDRYEEPLFLQFTSGSTSEPKGVKISMKNLISNFDMITHVIKHNGEPINCLTWMPLYHDMGLIGTVLYPIYKGGRATVMSPLEFLKSPYKWLEMLTKFQSNASGAPNFAYELVLKKVTDEEAAKIDLSNLKWLFDGAEPIRHDSISRFLRKFNLSEEVILPVYGLAESTLIVSGYRNNPQINTLNLSKSHLQDGIVKILEDDNNDMVKLVSCGAVGPNIQIEIVNPETFETVPEDTIGEICILSESVSSGYWENEEETLNNFTLTRNGERIPFLKTGDLGFLHNNELYITGRKKDLLIINGRNFYPQDIELVIERSDENVRTGCTAAFSVQGDLSEELVVVAEVKKKPSENEMNVIRIELSRHFQLIPKDIKFIAPRTILKTTSGKIRRREIRQRYLDNKLTPI